MKTFLLGGVAVFLGLYLLLLFAVFFGQRRLQYFPSRVDTAGRGNSLFTPWRSEAGDFLGYARIPSGTARKTLLFFHGNGGEALDRSWIADLASTDYVILLVEYPGYGASPGNATEPTIFTRALQSFDEARRRFNLPVVVLGESLGTGVASHVASLREIDRLALISPFTSALDIGAAAYPFLPVRWLMKDHFDSVTCLKKVKAPLHIVHGSADQVVPRTFGRKLYDGYEGEEKYFTELPGVGHNDIWMALATRNAERFRDFINR